MTAPGPARRGGRSLEGLEIELLLTAIARRYGYHYEHYTPASLRRRLQRALQEEGLRTLSALQERILHDPDAFVRLVSILSVHVTGMFRDPGFFRALRETVVPMLRTYPFVRVWHAGCSTGEEAYSLAIVLLEEGLGDRLRIYATDISGRLIEIARRGVYPLAAMKEYTESYYQSGGRTDFSSYYWADRERARLREELRRPIVFSQHNLASDRSFNEFHLILCRNVMIYFDRELTMRVHQLLYDSLVRLGVLALGMRESLLETGLSERYRPLSEEYRIWRKVG